jgi:hypothetical protein
MVWTLLNPILFLQQYCIFNYNGKFCPNCILVNISKLKPYQMLEETPRRLEAQIERGKEFP